MNINFSKKIAAALVIAAVACVACKKKDDTVKVTGVTLNQSTLALTEGKSATLTATVVPDNATNAKVAWTTSDSEVAAVSGGTVTAVKAGEADITVTTEDGKKTDVCRVTVTAEKTVAVGAQDGTLTAGTAGTAAFAVTTSGIADGEYAAGVANLPAGVSVSGKVTISANAGTLTLAGDAATAAGETATLTLTIDGATSAAFTLTIAAPGGNKTVTVGTQNGALSEGTAGTATFPVTTANIADGQAGTITWYANAGGTFVGMTPIGVTATVTTVANNAATVTANTTAGTQARTYYFRVTIDGIRSAVMTLRVAPAAAKTVTVGTQNGTLSAGTPGSATFAVTTANIADGQAGTIAWYATAAGTSVLPAAPAGITATVTGVAGNAATVTVNTTAVLAAGSGYFKVTIDGVTSGVATLTVGTPAVTGPSMTMTTAKNGDVAFYLRGTGLAKVDWGVSGAAPAFLTLNTESNTTFSYAYTSSLSRTITITGENITYLSSGDNGLTTMTANANTKLTYLNCLREHLTALSVSGMNALTTVAAYGNRMNADALNALISSLPGGGEGKTIRLAQNPGFEELTYSNMKAAGDKKWTDPDYVFVTGLLLNKQTTTLGPGESEQLTAIFTPSNATNKTLVWESSDAARATVDATGKVTVAANPTPGETGITATASGGSNMIGSCSVIIPPFGTEKNPFKVATLADLQKVGRGADGWTLTAHYRQTANITLNAVSYWTPIGTVNASFNGTYDGGGFSISGLITSLSGDDHGLFGVIGGDNGGGVVKNLRVVIDRNGVRAANNAGGIAGRSWGRVENCIVTNSLVAGGTGIGGVVGNNHGTIRNCYATVSVVCTDMNAGGITGFNAGDGTIENCYATGSVTVTNGYGGGIAGNNVAGGVIRNSVAMNPKVHRSEYINPLNIGRVAGTNSGTLTNNHARSAMKLTSVITIVGEVDVDLTAATSGGKDGANAIQQQTHGLTSHAWWLLAATLGPAFPAASWDFAVNRLPHLKTTTGSAFNQAQNPVPMTP